jgi:hypothetical protein
VKCAWSGIAIVCGPDVVDASVEVKGRVVHFDFDEMFGPLVTTKRGKPLAKQPGERDPFWPAFEAWLDKRRGLPPKCGACRGEGHTAEMLSKRIALAKPCPECKGSGRALREGTP